MDLDELFSSPGQPHSGEGFIAPDQLGELAPGDRSGLATPIRWPAQLVRSDMSPAQEATWAREGGWAAYRLYLREIAEHLGGKLDIDIYVLRSGDGGMISERYEITWLGEEIEL